jgi:hypothetical protein
MSVCSLRGNSKYPLGNLRADNIPTSSLKSMDWSQLKRLVLAPTNPVAFFHTFTDRLPLLEQLDISYCGTHDPAHPDLQTCFKFLTSLSMLKAITVRCASAVLVRGQYEFWVLILRYLGRHLQKLTVQALLEGLEAPYATTWMKDWGPVFQFNLRTLELVFQASAPPRAERCRYCAGSPHALVRSHHFLQGLTTDTYRVWNTSIPYLT